MIICHLVNVRIIPNIATYRQMTFKNIEKYIEIELLTTNIDIENFSNIVQP